MAHYLILTIIIKIVCPLHLYRIVYLTGKKFSLDMRCLVKDGIVNEVVPSSAIPAGYRRRDIPGALLAPAFMDLQIYGGNGKMFSTELTIESLDATYEYCLGGGCTQFMITMATTSIEKFLSGIEVVRDYWAQGGKGLLGLHMEGPYINPVKKGAHLEKFIKTPTVEEVKMILDKGRGAVKYITLAPELCDPEIIQMILHLGIIVSAGHSNANYQEATAAFDAGIPVATHLFNAMSPLQHRAPGLVGAIYDHPKAKSSVVCDGIHVDFPAVRISKKIMGDRLFYITDAVAEVKHGEYQHIFKGDRYTLPDGTLSGSALTMPSMCKKRGGTIRYSTRRITADGFALSRAYDSHGQILRKYSSWLQSGFCCPR